jgi:hypothetical protein
VQSETGFASDCRRAHPVRLAPQDFPRAIGTVPHLAREADVDARSPCARNYPDTKYAKIKENQKDPFSNNNLNINFSPILFKTRCKYYREALLYIYKFFILK